MITTRRNRDAPSQGCLIVNKIGIVKNGKTKKKFKFNVILMYSILLTINPRVQEPAKIYRILRFKREIRK